jgi:hypothetical protein
VTRAGGFPADFAERTTEPVRDANYPDAAARADPCPAPSADVHWDARTPGRHLRQPQLVQRSAAQRTTLTNILIYNTFLSLASLLLDITIALQPPCGYTLEVGASFASGAALKNGGREAPNGGSATGTEPPR